MLKIYMCVNMYIYIWASLVAQLVKSPPAMQETWVRSLGWEDPLEKKRLPTPVFWPGESEPLNIFNFIIQLKPLKIRLPGV